MRNSSKIFGLLMFLIFFDACTNAHVNVSGLKTSGNTSSLPPGYEFTSGRAQITYNTYTTKAKVIGYGVGTVVYGGYTTSGALAQ